MRVRSRRRSSRRVRSRSLIAGVATGLGSIGAFALGMAVVMPDIGLGPSDPLPAYYASVDELAGTGAEGEVSGSSDPLDENANDARSLPSSPNGEFTPGDRAGSDWTDSLPDSGALDQGESASNSSSSTHEDEAAAGRVDRGNTNHNRVSHSNASASDAFFDGENPESGGVTFVTGAAFTADQNHSDLDTGEMDPGEMGVDNTVSPGMEFPGTGLAQTGPPFRQTTLPQEMAPNSQTDPDTVVDNGLSPPPDGPGRASEPGNAEPGLNTPTGQSIQTEPGQSAVAVPEPATLGMMAFGLFAMWNIRSLRRRQ